MTKLHIGVSAMCPGQQALYCGDCIRINLFGQTYEHVVTAADLEGFDIEIKPIYTHEAQRSAMEWASQAHGNPWVPGGKDESCSDCKGKGVIELFNSTVPCKCRGG